MKSESAFFWSLLMAATVSSSLLAVAGDPQPQALKPVIFSGPAPDKESAPDQPDSIQLDDPFRAPLSFGKGKSDPTPLPPPPLNNSRPEANTKDWILMTPEEILGVKTPEQILGVENDADSSTKTPEQRFLDRQRQWDAGTTNGVGGGLFNDSTRWSGTKEFKEVKMTDQTSESSSGLFQNLGRILETDRPGEGLFQQNQNTGWTPAPQVRQMDSVAEAKHKADMDQFRELLGEQPERKVAATPVNYYDSPSQRAREGSGADPAFANPFGTSVKQLNMSVTKPVAPAPLTEWGSAAKKKVEAPPSWAPKPPPWLSQDPNTPLQRKF
jgi:hypothetical protein